MTIITALTTLVSNRPSLRPTNVAASVAAVWATDSEKMSPPRPG